MMLAVDGVDAFYGESQALYGVSLEVGPGEALALLGANGAGKTTTLRAILGLTPARRGRIAFENRVITRMATHAIARLGISWVPDDRRLCPTLTVLRNLALGQKRTRFRPWTVGEVCEVFTALPHLLDREAENLSGGEMQMVAIGRALLGSPGLVLFDEPSQGLAPRLVQEVYGVMARLKAEGVAMIVVEQNAELALAIADRAVVLDLGRVVHSGPAAALLADVGLRRRVLGA